MLSSPPRLASLWHDRGIKRHNEIPKDPESLIKQERQIKGSSWRLFQKVTMTYIYIYMRLLPLVSFQNQLLPTSFPFINEDT